jgi:hypothetical protein
MMAITALQTPLLHTQQANNLEHLQLAQLAALVGRALVKHYMMLPKALVTALQLLHTHQQAKIPEYPPA